MLNALLASLAPAFERVRRAKRFDFITSLLASLARSRRGGHGKKRDRGAYKLARRAQRSRERERLKRRLRAKRRAARRKERRGS